MTDAEKKKIMHALGSQKKILTSRRQPIPACSPGNLSRLHTSCALLFNKARLSQKKEFTEFIES